MQLLFPAAAAAACIALPAGAQDASTPTGATEPQRVEVRGTPLPGYVTRESASATKSAAPLLATPMAVQAVSEDMIRDRGFGNLLDAVRTVSGVQGQPGSFYDQFQIRGFGSGYGVSYRNGLQLEGIADAVNPAFIERIEVVKGPASMLYGRVEPGGFVNVVTRRPQATEAFAVEQVFSSWNTHSTTLDATGPLAAQGTLNYRVIGSFLHGDDYYDFQHHDRRDGYAALAWKPDARFEANVQLELYDDRSGGRGPNTVVPHEGTRPVSGVPLSLSGSDPALWASFPDTVQRRLLALDWTLQLGAGWTLTQRLHTVHVDEVQTGLGDWGGVWGFIDNPLTRSIFQTNVDLAGRVQTGSVHHELLIGVDAYRYKDHWKGYVGATDIPVVTAYEPGHTDLTPALQGLADLARDNVLWNTHEADTGLYLQDRMSWGSEWTVLAGLRHDRAWQRYAATYGSVAADCFPHCTGEPMNDWPADSATSPRLAVLRTLDAQSSVYGSYAKSFGTNNSSYLPSGSRVPPEIAEQFEAGYKRSLLDGRLLATATLFQLTKRNVLAPDPQDRTRQIAIGEVRSRGLELDAAGQFAPRWSVQASYTRNPVTITRDTNDPSNEGHRRAGAPLQAASLWLKYDGGQGLYAGAGVQANGQRQGDDENTWQMPGYAVVDAMAGWRLALGGHAAELQLNVKNLFDRRYYDQISYGAASYGTPRSAALSLRWAL